jgi:hypothetical protein
MTAPVALYRWISRFDELTQEKGQILIYRNPPPKTMGSSLARTYLYSSGWYHHASFTIINHGVPVPVDVLNRFGFPLIGFTPSHDAASMHCVSLNSGGAVFFCLFNNDAVSPQLHAKVRRCRLNR